MVARLARLGVPTVAPCILRTLPHDPAAFTQGLAYWEGQLYESTGGHHRSSLRAIDPQDGRAQRIVAVDGDFAEGIAVVGGKLYQLSWRSGKARVYSLPDLVLIDELRYRGEGWGLAASDGKLLMSDGSSVLSFCDAKFGLSRTLRVKSRGLPIRRLNDLECVGRSIYANVWPTTDIFELSAETGKVLRIVDCSRLAAAARPRDQECVLNGIAYNADNGAFFVTGKNWNLIFEVAIPPLADGVGPASRPNGQAAIGQPGSLVKTDRTGQPCMGSIVGPV